MCFESKKTNPAQEEQTDNVAGNATTNEQQGTAQSSRETDEDGDTLVSYKEDAISANEKTREVLLKIKKGEISSNNDLFEAIPAIFTEKELAVIATQFISDKFKEIASQDPMAQFARMLENLRG